MNCNLKAYFYAWLRILWIKNLTTTAYHLQTEHRPNNLIKPPAHASDNGSPITNNIVICVRILSPTRTVRKPVDQQTLHHTV